MKKYYIGIAIICAVTFGFVGYAAYLGAVGKQDVEVEKKVTEIADKLNNYIANNQKIPDNLEEVAGDDIPSAIKYTKQSDSEYTFCVTYKSASSYDVRGLEGALLGAGLGGASYNYDDYQYPDDQNSSSLYFYGSHKKGENCKTVKPYLANTNPNIFDTLDSSRSLDSISTNTKDLDREGDINTIHAQLEMYYAENGSYPSLGNMNDKSWRTTNMKGLYDSDLTDPDSSSTILVIQPKAGAYAYAVTPSSCNNASEKCTGYTLTATLENRELFSKKALN